VVAGNGVNIGQFVIQSAQIPRKLGVKPRKVVKLKIPPWPYRNFSMN